MYFAPLHSPVQSYDLGNLVTIINQTRDLDISSHGVTNPLAKILCSLSRNTYGEDGDDLSAIRNCSDAYQKHLFFSFLYVDFKEVFYNMLKYGHLNISVWQTTKENVEVGIISGTLAQFRDAFIEGSSFKEVRQFYTEVMNYFEKNGLSGIYAPYTTASNSDGTRSLVLRR